MGAITSYSQYLPGVLAEIAEVAGLDAALKVAEAKGGHLAYFPRVPKPDHWLVDLVGTERAVLICERVAPGDGGVQESVPLGPTGSRAKMWRRMHEMIDEGRPKPEIVRTLGVHRATVQRHKNGHSGQPKSDPDQGELF